MLLFGMYTFFFLLPRVILYLFLGVLQSSVWLYIIQIYIYIYNINNIYRKIQVYYQLRMGFGSSRRISLVIYHCQIFYTEFFFCQSFWRRVVFGIQVQNLISNFLKYKKVTIFYLQVHYNINVDTFIMDANYATKRIQVFVSSWWIGFLAH